MSKSPLPRGLIEVSNLCQKDCLYCGIRRGNPYLSRYRLTAEQVLTCVDEAVKRGYPAIALQAGEIESEANTAFYERILEKLPPKLEVTLSLGEQTEEVYRRWMAAAGDRVVRYLLRIEASTPERYARLHPADHSFVRRLSCIRLLKRIGFVTGSGVLIGVPGQTKRDLEDDLAFFVREQLHMVGMGPYIPHPDTPLGAAVLKGELTIPPPEERLELALWMIRETRRRLPHINIVAATALEALDPNGGRAKGLAAGANVIMPDLTPPLEKCAYALYPGKATAS